MCYAVDPEPGECNSGRGVQTDRREDGARLL